MKSLFIVMQGGSHACAIIIPTPRAVFGSRKAANKYIKERKHPHEWYVRLAADLTERDL